MPQRIQYLTALAAICITAVHGAMGPAFSTGPVADDTFIRESTATLILPKAPSNNNGDASLWVGMGTSNGDLVQSIADNWQSEDWSIYAYTLLSTSANTQMPVQDDTPSTAVAGDRVTMHYTYSDDTGNYTQSVLLNGQEVSTLSTSDEHALGWGSAVECAADDCGTMPAHTWEDVKITLDVADPDYIGTVGKGEGVTGELVTEDGGKTWTVDVVGIPEFTFGS